MVTTFGIEEELLIVDADSGALATRSPDLLDAGPARGWGSWWCRS